MRRRGDSRTVAPAVAPDRLPMPPAEMRRLVGPTDDDSYDNPAGEPVFGLPAPAYERVLDFGCGCGRVARQLIQQRPQPGSYLGIDIHRGMVRWAEQNLAPHASQFSFAHHDVFNVSLNPGKRKPASAPFPGGEDAYTLVLAASVFTHLEQAQAEHYLRECARVLAPGGMLFSTWFLFERSAFPMLQADQSALYINLRDPSNAVIFERSWLRETSRAAGLVITEVAPPAVRGFQWVVKMAPAGAGVHEAEFPPDEGEPGVVRAPQMPERAWNIE